MELTQGVRFDTLELSPEILRALLERNIVQSTPCLLYTSRCV